MKHDRNTLLCRIESGEKLNFVLFWKHHELPGAITKACLSQWYPACFTVDGVQYSCTEQYMMAQKALLFDDTATYEKIMASDAPHEYKSLGRVVKNFDAAVWDSKKYEIVKNGNLAKFSQNEALMDFLLATGNAVLAEASPYDKIWGIKLPEEDARAYDPKSWKGESLLGFALMEVRDILRKTHP